MKYLIRILVAILVMALSVIVGLGATLITSVVVIPTFAMSLVAWLVCYGWSFKDNRGTQIMDDLIYWSTNIWATIWETTIDTVRGIYLFPKGCQLRRK